MIKVQNVSFTYKDGTQALEDVSVTFPEEHIFAIMGLSGSGKTTLLNCIARFLRPDSGSILLDDEDIFEMEESNFRQQLGVVFQRLNLFPHLTVLENMMLAPRRVQGRRKKEIKEAASEMLDRLGIPELAHSYPSHMSGGQAQRVAIARGLMLRPKAMLLDEPTSALDAKTTSEFSDWLCELKSDTGFIIVTHDLPFAEQVAEKGMYISEGKVKDFGKIHEILKEIKTDGYV